MQETFLKNIDPLLLLGFRLHDFVSGFVARHLMGIKQTLIIIAHLSLLGIFFPEAGKGYGSLSINLLFLIVFLSPLSKIFRMRLLLQMMGMRRELGILMGYLAIVHGITYLIPAQSTDPSLLPPYFWLGIIALFLTLPLLLTANTFFLRLLGGIRWKRLHRLVYPLLVMAVFHQSFRAETWDALLSDERAVGGLIQGVIILLLYVFFKLLARRNFLRPLERAITFVAGRYAQYGAAKSVAPEMPH